MAMLSLVYSRYDLRFMKFPKIIYEEDDDLPRIRRILGLHVGSPSSSEDPSQTASPSSPASPDTTPATQVHSLSEPSVAKVAVTHARPWQPGRGTAEPLIDTATVGLSQIEGEASLQLAPAPAPTPTTTLGGWNPGRARKNGPQAETADNHVNAKTGAQTDNGVVAEGLLVQIDSAMNRLVSAMGVPLLVDAVGERAGATASEHGQASDWPAQRGEPAPAVVTRYLIDRVETLISRVDTALFELGASHAPVFVRMEHAEALAAPTSAPAAPSAPLATPSAPSSGDAGPPASPLQTAAPAPGPTEPTETSAVVPSEDPGKGPEEHAAVIELELVQAPEHADEPAGAETAPIAGSSTQEDAATGAGGASNAETELRAEAAPQAEAVPVLVLVPEEMVVAESMSPDLLASGTEAYSGTADIAVQPGETAHVQLEIIPQTKNVLPAVHLDPGGEEIHASTLIEADEPSPSVNSLDLMGWAGTAERKEKKGTKSVSARARVVFQAPAATEPEESPESIRPPAELDVTPPVVQLGDIDMAYGWRASVAAKTKARHAEEKRRFSVQAERNERAEKDQQDAIAAAALELSLKAVAVAEALIVGEVPLAHAVPDGKVTNLVDEIASTANALAPATEASGKDVNETTVTNDTEPGQASAMTISAPAIPENDFEGAEAIAESHSNIVLAVEEAIIVGENEGPDTFPPGSPPIESEEPTGLVNTDEIYETDLNDAPDLMVQWVNDAPESTAVDAENQRARHWSDEESDPQDDGFLLDDDPVDVPTSDMTIPPTIPGSVNPQDRLVQACLEGQYKLVVALLASGADPNALGHASAPDGSAWEGITPLQATILATASVEEVTPKMLRKQTARIVRVLLSRGALTVEIERDLVHHCANHNLAEVLEVLAEHNVRLRRYGYDLVAIAMHHGHLDVLQVLNGHNCAVNLQNDKGSRPFLDICSGTVRAAITGRKPPIASVEVLAERLRTYIALGLDLEAADKVGATPLMRAIVTGNETMAWALLACGASPRVVMRNGVCITHLAAACMGSAFLRQFLKLTDTQSELRRLQARRLQPDVRAIVQAVQVAKAA